MSSVREKAGKISLFIAGSAFRAALTVLVVVLLIWLGRTAYDFGYQVFNEQAMSPGQGTMVSVVIPEGSSVYEIGKILESKGLINNAYVFVVQERISNYHGKLLPGTYRISTAYKPTMIMGQLAGEEELEGAGG